MHFHEVQYNDHGAYPINDDFYDRSSNYTNDNDTSSCNSNYIETQAVLCQDSLVFRQGHDLEWGIKPYNNSICIYKKHNGIIIDSIDLFQQNINIQTAHEIHETNETNETNENQATKECYDMFVTLIIMLLCGVLVGFILFH